MKKKSYFVIPFLALVLVFSFGLTSCETDNNEDKISDLENEIIDKNKEIDNLKSELSITKYQLKFADEKIDTLESDIVELEQAKEESIEEPTEEEVKDYIATIVVIGLKVSLSTGTFSQSCQDVDDGKISTSKNKEDASNLIKDINDCHDIYSSLKVPENFSVPHGLMGTAMDHFINATIYLQQYIDTKDISDMTGYLDQAIVEMTIGHECFAKATEQYNKLAPESTEEPIEEVEPKEEVTEEVVKEPEEGEEDLNTTETSSGATLGEKNAVKKALDYLAYTSFSYSGLVEQLEYEGFTHEEAVYGVDKCGADWKEQAALKAEDYLDYSSFSRTELIAQLEYEGFTHEEAVYGVQAVGY